MTEYRQYPRKRTSLFGKRSVSSISFYVPPTYGIKSVTHHNSHDIRFSSLNPTLIRYLEVPLRLPSNRGSDPILTADMNNNIFISWGKWVSPIKPRLLRNDQCILHTVIVKGCSSDCKLRRRVAFTWFRSRSEGIMRLV